MIKPKRLKPGDTVAVVSLSWGGLGEPELIHKYYIAKERLERDFGLTVKCMPHALMGCEFVAKNPHLRAHDLMEAFRDPSVSAIICAIGGDDTIRTLPYVDFDVIRSNPKIFMGYSDTTVNHFMMQKAGLVSFYGPCIMCEFGEYVKMFDYTKKAVEDMLFGKWDEYDLLPSPEWTDDHVRWCEENINTPHKMKKDTHGCEVINGSGVARGRLMGGCIDVFTMVLGTSVFPTIEEWTGAILFIETSEDKPTPDFITWTLRNFAAQGILGVLSGIIVGKPKDETYYEEYKAAILKVVAEEEHLTNLPVFYNINVGHAKPTGILPLGIETELDCGKKRIRFLESPTVE